MLSDQTSKKTPKHHKNSNNAEDNSQMDEAQNPSDTEYLDNDSEELKFHKQNRKSVSSPKRKLSKNLKTTGISNDSNLSSQNDEITNVKDPPVGHSEPVADPQDVIYKAEIINFTTEHTNASVTSSKKDDDIQRHVGFRKNSPQPHKVSAQTDNAEPYLKNDSTNEHTRRHSIASRKTGSGAHDRGFTQVPRSSQIWDDPHILMSAEPKNPVIEGIMTSLSAVFDEEVGVIEPTQAVAKIPRQKTNSRNVSKTKTVESTNTDSLSQQTMYNRAARKLPSSGPLSIRDVDDFLKRSKVDFDHFYHQKPISNLQITEFTLLKTLGIGAFGKVVLGEMKKDKTLYAVKIIDKVGVVKRNHVRYVSNEKRILQALNFPFVINLTYFFTDYYYLYFVMPYVPGGTFYKYLKTCKKVTENDARFYIGQLILALEYLHYLDLIHRDMKTENVMIDAFGYLKLVDFGQCIRCYNNDKTWTFTGTPDYMAPEIIVGKGYDCSVDWWALGIITYEMCAGFRPFRNENTRKLQLLILCNQFAVPSSFSRSLKKLIESLLVLEPKKRIANSNKKASMLKKHIWFKGLDWLALLNRTLEAPYLPNIMKTSTAVQ